MEVTYDNCYVDRNASGWYYMRLKPEEAVAINCHMGFTDGGPNTLRDVENAYESCPLAWVIHVADEAATWMLERR